MWIISQTLQFSPGLTFLAKSVFFGPTTSNELEIEPIVGFSPSNWPSNSEPFDIAQSYGRPRDVVLYRSVVLYMVLYSSYLVIIHTHTCIQCLLVAVCHAIHAGNASSELVCLENLEQFVQTSTLPLLPHLLAG